VRQEVIRANWRNGVSRNREVEVGFYTATKDQDFEQDCYRECHCFENSVGTKMAQWPFFRGF